MGFRETMQRQKIKNANRLARLFYGRNGPDTICKVCIWSSFAIALVQIFTGWRLLSVLYLLLFGYAMFRFFSRQTAKRQKENAAFCRFFRSMKAALSVTKKKLTDRTHAYRRCPHCKSYLRLPRSKGTHTVKCPKCGVSFSVKI